MEYITSFTEHDLCKLILQTEESLYICLPLLQPAVFRAIDEMDFNNMGKARIHIAIDFSSESFRQGYGEIDSYEDLYMNDYHIRHLKDNRISFVISDSIGFFLFFESRYFIPAEKKTYNGVRIDAITIVRLKQHFFQTYQNNSEYTNEIANAVIDETEHLKSIGTEFNKPPVIKSAEIDSVLYDSIKADLDANPPLKPDYKRIVDYYSNKMQYVRLEFFGSNFSTKKIELPPDAIPVNDIEFKKRLESKLQLFDREQSFNAFQLLNAFKYKVQKLRNDFLTPLKSRKESILIKLLKLKFMEEFNKLMAELETVKEKSLELIAEQVDATRRSLIHLLTDFYLNNIETISKTDLFANSTLDYKQRTAQNKAIEVAYRIKWPVPHQIFKDFKLSVQFSDITFEDLQNEDFKHELMEKRLISSTEIHNLAEFGKGIKLED